ncbi:MAG: hypothetical protein HY271_19085 [Deltaproteobacteria bacterium]|nr:hypothetical protein [Deltaproteobacteria bacterium]
MGDQPDGLNDGLNQEGGCAVDWSWLTGEEIVSVTSSLDTLTVRFQSGETLEVRRSSGRTGRSFPSSHTSGRGG